MSGKNNELISKLSILLSDTYALYLKTQNYHWHVKGLQFKSLHELFETQYKELAEAVDSVAERIVIKGYSSPATFVEFERLKTIKDGRSDLDSNAMLSELAGDHDTLVGDLHVAMALAQNLSDEGTVNLLADRIEAHEKSSWMLKASCA